MTLFLVKTHDLSWQDHTINVEVMLSPSKSTLLSNKHKALASKCDAIKRNFDKERDSFLQDIKIEKRLMERKKDAIFRRRSEILFKKCSKDTSVSSLKDTESVSSKRINSAPSSTIQSSGSTYQTGNIGSNGRSFFLTEYNPIMQQKSECHDASTDGRSGRTSCHSDVNTLASTNMSMRGSYLKSPYFSSNSPSGSGRFSDVKRLLKVPSKSVRFDDSQHMDEKLFTRLTEMSLDDKIKHFIKDQEEFNNKPAVINFSNRPNSEPTKRSSPLVAKKYRSLKLATEEIEKAFDDFCNKKNKEEFHKLVKITSKLRANVRMARNVSLTPSLAAFKCAKVFKSKIKTA